MCTVVIHLKTLKVNKFLNLLGTLFGWVAADVQVSPKMRQNGRTFLARFIHNINISDFHLSICQ